MTRLPAPLEPWAAWLTLFAPDLIPAVGELLLRLQPLIGKLSTATPVRGIEPAGIGNIVRRGNYERLLMTEWVYADAEPDEFIRRAGNGELLFNGPEPALHQRSLRSVALFDAGLAQLGEPRLAQMALFILLARRAEQADAQFSWGILQQPGILHDDTGLGGIRKLLKSRSLLAPPADAREQWQAVFDAEQTDCWFVGGGEAPLPIVNRILIRRALSGNFLQVSLQQRHDRRALQLELPDTPTAVRLLRAPFTPAAPLGVFHHRGSRPSRAQAPRFSSGGNWLCVAQVGGGAIVYNVPQSAQSKPGKHRVQAAPTSGAILAAGVFKPNLSFITSVDGKLDFHGFPGPLFSGQRTMCERPPQDDFHAPPGMARWLPTFYLLSRDHAHPSEDVVVLDAKKRLVCWRADKRMKNQANSEPQFLHIANDVIGIQQVNNILFFASADGDGIDLYTWSSQHVVPLKQGRLEQAGRQLLYGGSKERHRNYNFGLMAIQRSTTSWSLGKSGVGETIEVEEGVTVLGVVLSKKHAQAGLVVLHPAKRRIELRVGQARHELAATAEPIQHACMDVASSRIAWITAKTSTVVVRAIDDDQPLLQISHDGGLDES